MTPTWNEPEHISHMAPTGSRHAIQWHQLGMNQNTLVTWRLRAHDNTQNNDTNLDILGVQFGSRLTMKVLVRSIVSRASERIGIFMVMRSIFDDASLMMSGSYKVYDNLLHCLMHRGSPLWGGFLRWKTSHLRDVSCLFTFMRSVYQMLCLRLVRWVAPKELSTIGCFSELFF